MMRNVEVQNTSARHFNDDEHIDQLERCRHDNKKVTGNDRFSMVAHEGHPPLLRVGRPPRRIGHVTSNGARGNLNANLQQEFIGDTLFAPSWITSGHFSNELSNTRGPWRTAAGPRFPLPKQPEAFTVPSGQGFLLDDNESFPPIKPTRQLAKRESDRIAGAPWFDLTLDEKAELFPKE